MAIIFLVVNHATIIRQKNIILHVILSKLVLVIKNRGLSND